MKKKFRGTGVAIVTPFHKDETIDFTSLKKLIDFQIENKVDYIVALGTTGESATLNKDEKKALIEFVIETVDKRTPIVVGIGGNNTREVLKTIDSTEFENIDAILSVCPYYNKPTQEGIYQHYKAVATNSPAPVIMYNVPGRTGVNMSAETTLRLAKDFKNLFAVKEASGNLSQIMHIIKNKPENFMVISGDDGITLPMIAVGADGVISVTANAFPFDFSEMVRLALKSNISKAKEIHYKLLDIYDALFMEGSPGGIKAALDVMGLCKNHFKLPVVPVSKKTYDHIKQLIKQY